jgi:hypothetical protein
MEAPTMRRRALALFAGLALAAACGGALSATDSGSADGGSGAAVPPNEPSEGNSPGMDAADGGDGDGGSIGDACDEFDENGYPYPTVPPPFSPSTCTLDGAAQYRKCTPPQGCPCGGGYVCGGPPCPEGYACVLWYIGVDQDYACMMMCADSDGANTCPCPKGAGPRPLDCHGTRGLARDSGLYCAP